VAIIPTSKPADGTCDAHFIGIFLVVAYAAAPAWEGLFARGGRNDCMLSEQKGGIIFKKGELSFRKVACRSMAKLASSEGGRLAAS
jgi:hypothetical protein